MAMSAVCRHDQTYAAHLTEALGTEPCIDCLGSREAYVYMQISRVLANIKYVHEALLCTFPSKRPA